jgi:2-iminobutanoate/2-iminopropanoate deaminase
MTLAKTRISAEGAPKAIGPYSQAVQLGGMLYASGQIALDPATGNLVEGGIREQTERVLQNVSAVLASAGCSLADVVKTTVFLKDMNDYAAMNEVYGSHMPAAIPPARSTVQVARLPKDALVEIEVIAAVPEKL